MEKYRVWLVLASIYLADLAICQIYSSSGELARVFRLERELVEVLKAQKERIEDGLDNIFTYTKQVEEMYDKEDCPMGECDQDHMTETIVGNPIYSYQLLKRLHVSFKNVETALRDIDVKK